MELHGSTFTLRGWRHGYETSLQEHADDPNVSAYLFDRYPNPYTLKDAEDWVAYCMEQDPLVNFAIDVDGQVVGGIALELRADVYRKTPLIGYWLGQEYWGRGIMPEAVKLVTNYAFYNLDIISIQALVFSGNPKSMRVLEKAGYQKQGVIKSSVYKNDVIYDEHVYSALGPVE